MRNFYDIVKDLVANPEKEIRRRAPKGDCVYPVRVVSPDLYVAVEVLRCDGVSRKVHPAPAVSIDVVVIIVIGTVHPNMLAHVRLTC